MKKSMVMFAALLAVSAAPVVGFCNAAAATTSSVVNYNGTLHNASLVTAEMQIPKCYPYCGG